MPSESKSQSEPVPAPPPRIIGTAGHIDHGKSRLVLALSGVDPDRLPEEKARGITIDLGFAPLRLPGGRRAAFVDVPGHERFVRTMVAGASGVDLALLAVALDEGPMPQTREHLAVLELLGIERLVVALTKADLVEEEWKRLVEAEVAALLAGGPYAQAPMVAVSATTGTGLDALRSALADALDELPGRAADGPMRLCVDRVFSRPGFGTVVTGTLASGRVAPEDRLLLLPQGTEVRVRAVEVHGESRRLAVAGERTALNLGGVGREAVRRGDVVAAPGAAMASRVPAADVRLLASAPALASGRTVHVHTGTAETSARLVWLADDQVDPRLVPTARPARLHLLHPLALADGDRLVLRAGSPLTTIGGATVLDRQGEGYRRRRVPSLEALERLRAGGPRARVLAHLTAAGGRPEEAGAIARACGLDAATTIDLLEALAREGRARPAPGGGWLAEAAWRSTGEAVAAFLAEYHRRYPIRAGAPREEVRRRAAPGLDGRRFALAVEAWASEGRLRAEREWLALATFAPAAEADAARAVAAVAAVYARAGLDPPALAEALRGQPEGEECLALLVAQGRLVHLGGGLYMDADAVARARARLAELLRTGPVSAAAFRDALGISRRTAVPLLEHFDALRLTRRVGDLHVAVATPPV